MRDYIPLVNLQHSADSLATVAFYNTEQYTQKASSVIQGYYHLPYTGAEHSKGDGADEAAKYSKAFVKGHKLAVKVANLINHGGSTLPVPLKVTGSGLVGGSPCEGHARLSEGITWFEKTHFHHHPLKPEGSNFTATHYLHFSTPLAHIIPGAEGRTQPMDLVQEITLISGMCLWTSKIIQASMPRGQRLDAQRLLSTKITLYEVEYLSRAVPVIADLATAISVNNPSKPTGLNICLDIPSFHYYHSLEERLRDGCCTFFEALRWMHAVEKRHRQLSQVFCRLLDHELSRRRGVHCRSRKPGVQISPLANLVYQFICDSLANNVFPDVNDILRILQSEDRTWAQFYALVPVNEQVTDFQGLSYLFYVYQVLRPALERDQVNVTQSSDAKTRLLISIDDAFERRIYSRSQKFLKKLRASLPPSAVVPYLLEVYLCRRIFINRNELGSNLYLDDPSPEPTVLRSVQGLVPEGKQQLVRAQDRQKSWSETVELDALDVVEGLYGSHIADVLKNFLAEVGLGY
ncbi:uncharacterized protein TRUGW13939_01400 [Talaromyces rugulosus]|uniref:Uncharacterized protein n=1 Tax=Talaromyces rugulosus TaxID=121627 RepID=A0A7H8QK78_TALRU|nr:uncharacterized protein TRUGW13939_01400 [Talaromyces rugulosus]QKX54314.1 hypothetical protein TRUGW13939_01400 [Talaromyces rugulosus]